MYVCVCVRVRVSVLHVSINKQSNIHCDKAGLGAA